MASLSANKWTVNSLRGLTEAFLFYYYFPTWAEKKPEEEE
jgi:hypothetical protein